MDEAVEILPLVVVVQAFPARPSSLPDIRDFVRRHVTQPALSEATLNTLRERTTEVLLEAAELGRVIQVSLRIFPDRAEVDVLHADLDDDAPVSPAPAVSAAADTAGVPAESFADWLTGALRRERMTMESAARRLGVSVKTVSRWASGVTQPRLSDLTRIREVFGDLPFP